MTQNTTNTIDRNTQHALNRLRTHLVADGSFSGRAIDSIIAWLREQGTLEGLAYIFPGEFDEFTQVYIDALGEVPFDNPQWGIDDSHWTSVDAVPVVSDVLTIQLFTIEPDDEEQRFFERWIDEYDPTPDQSWRGRGDDETLLPPIAGGTDEPHVTDEPYRPSEADWHEYDRWSRRLDYFEDFNRLRDDANERPA